MRFSVIGWFRQLFYLATYRNLPIYHYIITYTTFYITGLVYIVYLLESTLLLLRYNIL